MFEREILEKLNQLEKEVNYLKRLDKTQAASGVTDHGDLTGLSDNDHPQYGLDADVVHDTGDETIAGVKTFSSIPVLPGSDPTSDNEAARKAYVDSVAFTPSARVTRASSQWGFSGRSWAWVYWNSESWDNYNHWSSGSPTKLYARKAGWYRYWFNARISPSTGFYGAIRKNGNDYINVVQESTQLNTRSTDVDLPTMTGTIYLANGNYLEAGLYTINAGTHYLNTNSSDHHPEFGIEFIKT